MAINLIILDVDGTLADTAPDLTDAVNEVLRPLSVAPISLEETRSALGGGEKAFMEKLSGYAEAGLDPGRFRQDFARAYGARLVAKTRLYPGVRATLGRLTDLPMVILSNRRKTSIVPLLDRLGLLPLFREVIGRDSGVGTKPSPDPVLHLLRRFDTEADGAVIVGDCVHDIDAGRAAGITTVAVTYGYGVDHRFVEQADFVIPRFSGLLRVIDRLNPGRGAPRRGRPSLP
jgi:phosphoglycolate phosphatase